MEKDKLIGLVTKAQQGDNDALNELFNAFYNDLYYFALKTVKEDDLALDITQESFVEIINTIGNLQEPAAFVTWAKQITYHQCTRYFKKKKDVIVDEDEDGNTVFDTLKEENTEFIPDEALDQSDFKKTILGILDELSEEQRSAVMMYYFDEMSIKQIAEIQGTTEGTVKSRLNYGRKAIKSSVEEYEKKNGIKLHAIGCLPLIKWIFKTTFEGGMSITAAESVAGGVATATGATITATSATAAVTATTTAATAVTATTSAVGLGAKIAAIPIATKIIAGVVAASIAVAGGYTLLDKDDNILDDIISTVTDNSTQQPDDNNDANSEETETEDENTESLEDEVIEEGSFLVAKGSKYITADGKTFSEGQYVNQPPQTGDVYETVDYSYRYNYGKIVFNSDGPTWSEMGYDGWGLEVKDTTKGSYKPLEKEINGAPLKSIAYGFKECINMVTAPEIPDTVIEIDWAFYNCWALKKAPTLPSGPDWMVYTFGGCISLTETPYIPDGYINLSNAFNGCTSLMNVTNFPSNLKWLAYTFSGCINLKSVPQLPNKVEQLSGAFQLCTSLKQVPKIPASVQNMSYAFMGCTLLTGTMEINAVLKDDNIPCNDNCINCKNNSYNNCEECGDCCSYALCFLNTSCPIKIVGSCNKLNAIAKTSYKNNVTVG